MNQLFGILNSDLRINYCILVRSYNFEYAMCYSDKKKRKKKIVVLREECELDGVKPKEYLWL